MYFAEKDSAEKWSFFDSFWLGLMVLTTVGYGSTAPSTPAGKVCSYGGSWF
ncbi:MAG: ion channel [bacterium]